MVRNSFGKLVIQKILYNFIRLFLLFALSASVTVGGCSKKETVVDKNVQLIKAAEDGNLQTIQKLIVEGADINTKDATNGTTALWLAAENGYTKIVKFLLENGVDVNTKATADNVTALMIASQQGHTDIVKLLLEKDADVNVQASDNGATAMMAAAENGHTAIVKLLLEKVVDVDVKTTTDGATALIMAAQNGHIEIVKLLLEKGADVNAKTNDGVTALAAIQKCNNDIVQMLQKNVSTESPSLKPHNVPKQAPEPRIEICKENELVSIGYTSYRVLKSEWTSRLSHSRPPDQKPNAMFLLIELTVRNGDSKPRSIPPFRLIDQNGAEYETSSKSVYIEDSIDILDSLNPGVQKHGFIVFDIPKGHHYNLKVSGGYWSDEYAIIMLSPVSNF